MTKWNGQHLLQDLPAAQIFTDASERGYGIVWNEHRLAGEWSPEEAPLHINVKELLVIEKIFQHISVPNKSHLQLCMDNTSAIANIKKFGGTRSAQLNNTAMRIWRHCFRHSIQLSTLYVPSKMNPADAPSRALNSQIEWQLPPTVFHHLDLMLGPHSVDLFASPQNHLLPTFVTWNYHPKAMTTNALSMDWTKIQGRLFINPPWNLISLIAKKLLFTQTAATMITPNWPSAPWYPLMLQLTQTPPQVLLIPKDPPQRDPGPLMKNPLWSLLAWNIHPHQPKELPFPITK